LWSVNTGLATRPPRFSYFAGFGAVAGNEPPSFIFDIYAATRTPNGWVTTLPGLKGGESLQVARTRCSDAISVCIDHSEGETTFGSSPFEVAAELFDVSGNHLGTLPSNIGSIPGAQYAEDLQTDEQLSGSGKVYAFSSLNNVFAPGGV